LLGIAQAVLNAQKIFSSIHHLNPPAITTFYATVLFLCPD
jgi:hypothetical protein